MAEEINAPEDMFQSWDGKPIYAKKAERDVNGNPLELTIVDDVVTAIGGKSVGGGGSDIPAEGEVGQVLTKTQDGYDWEDAPVPDPELPDGGTDGQLLTKTQEGVAWEDPLSYTTKDVYDAEVYGGIIIENRNGTKVAILNDEAAYVPEITATVQSVEAKRKYSVGVMSTAWFPFSFKASELTNARIFKVNSATYVSNELGYEVTMDDVTELTGDDVVQACTPYLLIASNSTLQFSFSSAVSINTTERHSYPVTFNQSSQGGTFTICDNRINRFDELPGWDSNRYYGFAASDEETVKAGEFAQVQGKAFSLLYRSYLIRPNI